MAFANPMPDDKALDTYNSAYFENAHGGVTSNREAREFFSGMARLRVHHMIEFLSSRSTEPQRVLEVGPGPGYLCRYLQKLLPTVRYVGVEADESLHEPLREMGAEVCLQMSELSPGSFDLVVASHVLEHSCNPRGFVDSMYSMLVDGGVVFIEVPCRDFEFKEIDEPHLVFFDKSSLGHLLEQVGFHDAQLTYHGRNIEEIIRCEDAVQRLRESVSRYWRMAFRTVPSWLDFRSRGPHFIADAGMWSTLRRHEAHLTKERAAWWLRALAVK